MDGNRCDGLLNLVRRHEQRAGRIVEGVTGYFVLRGIATERQVVRGVRARSRKAKPFDGFGDHIRNRRRVGMCSIRGETLESAFGFQNGPREGGRIAAIDDDGIKAVEPEMIGEPCGAALLHDLDTLFDTPPVEDHDRDDMAGIFGPPPAGRPVRTALFLEGAVA